MRILLAVDGSRFSQAATRAVVVQAKPESDQILLIHVVDDMTNLIPEMRAYYPGGELGRNAQRKVAEDIVSEAKELLGSAHLSATEDIEWGDPKSKIIDVAVEWHADLIVLGSHGKTTLERVLTGSVADYVIRHAPCSVELVRKSHAHEGLKRNARTSSDHIDRILLAIDDTRASEMAACFLSKQIHSQRTEVRVFHTIQPPDVLLSREMGGYDPWLEQVWEDQKRDAEKLVSKVAHEFFEKGIKVSMRTLEGDARSKIIEEAWEWKADLLVIGSHGRKGFARFLSRSLSEALAHHSTCSVEIVRSSESDMAAVAVGRTDECVQKANGGLLEGRAS